MRAALRTLAALTALTLPSAACQDDDEDRDAGSDGARTSERPPRPPPGWRTVTNPVLGVSISAPKTWPADTSRRATLVRSDDQLVSITVAADRSPAGRRLTPARYARRTIRSLPGFRGRVQRRARRVRGSPYPSAVLDGRGTVSSTSRPQVISVAVFRDEGRASYSAIVFRNARVKPRFNDRTIARILPTLRGRAPRG